MPCIALSQAADKKIDAKPHKISKKSPAHSGKVLVMEGSKAI
jgi:hypothetical protein